MTDEICGHPTGKDGDGEPCQLSPSRSDGRCHHHTGIKEERATTGRPSKLDDVYDDVMDAAERGLTYEGIARVAGIGLSTLDDWRRDNPEFERELEQARAKGERILVERVAQEKPEFILERSYDYIKTEKHEVDQTTEGEQTITIRREIVDPDDE